MLENINLKTKLPREEFKRLLPALQGRLYDLEKACWDNGVPSVLVFEGWDASGKGTTIATLTQRLDPRGFKLYPVTKLWKAPTRKMINHTVLGTRFSNVANRLSATSNTSLAGCM